MRAGTLYDKAVLKVVVDGYTAPVSAGNFVDLVQRGLYKGMAIQRSDGFVIQTVSSFFFFFFFFLLESFAPLRVDVWTSRPVRAV